MTNDDPEAIIAAIPDDDAPVDGGEVLLEKLNHQIVKVIVIRRTLLLL